MVNLPPDPNDQQPSGRLRDNDEAIAVAIAFITMGAILWWGWTRGQRFFAPTATTPSLLEQPLIEEDDTILNLDDEAEADSGFLGLFEEETAEVLEEDAVVAEPERSETLRRRRSLVAVPSRSDTATGEDDTDAANQTVESAIADETTPPPLDISEVPEDYWAYPYIVDMYENGLLPDLPSGDLQPDRQLTRAEFAALLNSSLVQDPSTQRDLNFSDISDDYWAADAIRQVVDAGYMSGFPDGTFQPDQPVPRYQVLVTLASGLSLNNPDDPQSVLSPFQGVDNIPGWAIGQVAAAAQNNLIVNYPNPDQLMPQETATRAEIIVMMHQALLNQGRVEQISSPYVAPQN